MSFVKPGKLTGEMEVTLSSRSAIRKQQPEKHFPVASITIFKSLLRSRDPFLRGKESSEEVFLMNTWKMGCCAKEKRLHHLTSENTEWIELQIDPDHHPRNNCRTVRKHPVPSQHC
ncbi:uncharacterized protein LOC122541601 isoform X2 [Chiloscyllium plagiosum]|uniref:uncharacterized protein LOC122541601 isoform X2 n=1 Tax=Chiloscyllium plagiosum TaxID=36176 RepID=UPI001CB80149|nr:uncharacterized protein LOC122541601 isoform X2 [Chiloscyllium plagiosum]